MVGIVLGQKSVHQEGRKDVMKKSWRFLFLKMDGPAHYPHDRDTKEKQHKHSGVVTVHKGYVHTTIP